MHTTGNSCCHQISLQISGPWWLALARVDPARHHKGGLPVLGVVRWRRIAATINCWCVKVGFLHSSGACCVGEGLEPHTISSSCCYYPKQPWASSMRLMQLQGHADMHAPEQCRQAATSHHQRAAASPWAARHYHHPLLFSNRARQCNPAEVRGV